MTTYTYSTGSPSSETVSASDDERLAPGGFSLRHGFPRWFGRSQKSAQTSALSSRNVSDAHLKHANQSEDLYKPPLPEDSSSKRSSPRAESSRMANVRMRPGHSLQPSQQAKISEVLEYVKCAFDDEDLLDALPLEAAGNLGAWKAWRAYRRSCETDNKHFESAPDLQKQDEWSWDGVWEERVRKGIDASIAESTLYGGTSGGDDMVSILRLVPISHAVLISFSDSIRRCRSRSY